MTSVAGAPSHHHSTGGSAAPAYHRSTSFDERTWLEHLPEDTQQSGLTRSLSVPQSDWDQGWRNPYRDRKTLLHLFGPGGDRFNEWGGYAQMVRLLRGKGGHRSAARPLSQWPATSKAGTVRQRLAPQRPAGPPPWAGEHRRPRTAAPATRRSRAVGNHQETLRTALEIQRAYEAAPSFQNAERTVEAYRLAQKSGARSRAGAVCLIAIAQKHKPHAPHRPGAVSHWRRKVATVAAQLYPGLFAARLARLSWSIASEKSRANRCTDATIQNLRSELTELQRRARSHSAKAQADLTATATHLARLEKLRLTPPEPVDPATGTRSAVRRLAPTPPEHPRGYRRGTQHRPRPPQERPSTAPGRFRPAALRPHHPQKPLAALSRLA